MAPSPDTEAELLQVAAASAPLRRRPEADAPLDTELLFGETFMPDDAQDGWLHGVSSYDQYTGWIERTALAAASAAATHRVRVLRTYRYPVPDLKAPPLSLISMNAKLSLDGELSGRFVRETRGGWVFADHLAPVAETVADPVAVAEQFLGTPYYWGGRSSLGLDCSALVQHAFERAGMDVPRDSTPQRDYFSRHGEVLFDCPDGTDAAWRDIDILRGDLVFWNGHIVLAASPETIVHANATHMAVTVDPLTWFATRIADSEGGVRKIVRPAMPR